MSLSIIGELINNSYARARRAFTGKDLALYQQLAKSQAELGARYLTLNLDGTQRISVRQEEMLALLPDVIPAIQEVTALPLSFDNPAIAYHRVALEHYDRERSGRPIVNSLAASRQHLEEMIELVAAYDTNVVVMASEKFLPEGGGAQCLNAEDAYATTKRFVEMLVTRANRSLDQIIIDPGLAPVGADTYGLVNIGLDAMQRIHTDPDLQGIHMIVGLSNFAWGTPKGIREQLENAYLRLAMDRGLDFALANPEKSPTPLASDDPLVAQLQEALEAGRPREGESQEMAGYRQAEAIMTICASAPNDDEDW